MRAGFETVVAGVPRRLPGYRDSDRVSGDHLKDAQAVLARFTRPRVPISFIGTSRGTLSAIFLARQLGKGRVSNLVLSSTVFQNRVLKRLGATSAAQRTLLLHNFGDRCPSSPFAAFLETKAGASAKPNLRFESVRSDQTASPDPCDARTPHGFYGVERSAVEAIVGWITGK
jgi:hypothetical protein